MSASSVLIDADLHGLVDGQIEPGKRADALRRLAASPADRARVEGWQAQNDMLRSAFSGIDREAVPAMLDLRARPQLQCIPANDAPLISPIQSQPRPWRGRLAAGGLAAAITAGFIGGWLLLAHTTEGDDVPATSTRGTPIDAELARRTATALGTTSSAGPRVTTDLPTTRIPDLRAAGFRFVSAEAGSARPPAVLFRYQNANAERLVVSVARAVESVTVPPAGVGRAVSWQTGDQVFVLAGTPNAARLRAIATSLQRTTR